MTPEQFHVIAEPMPEPMLLVSGAGHILAGNRALEEHLGVSLRSMRGKTLAEVAADDADEIARYLRLCSRNRSFVIGALTLHSDNGKSSAFRAEGAVVHPRTNGTDATLLLRLKPKESASENFLALNQRIEELGKEIQRRKRAEEEARQQAEHLRVTLLSLGDAVIVTDPEALVTMMNPVAERLTGWKQEEAQGQHLETVFRIVNESTRRPVLNPALRALKEGRVVGLANHTILISKDNVEYSIDDSAAPMRNERGVIFGSVLVFRDITKQREAEEKLRQAQKMEAIGRLAGGIAHDFNNIMTIINGFSEMLLSDETLDSLHRDFAQNINEAAKRAASLTQQITAFSRKQLLVPTVLSLNDIVHQMGSMVQRLIGEDIQFTLETAPDLGRIKADQTQISQVVLNLATNARDAMRNPGGGRLRIATSNAVLDGETVREFPDVAPGRYAMLSVSDNGHGMSEEVLHHVFEPFFTTKEVGQGTGLGLATVYGIVKQSDGHIDVSSKVGEGTTFRVYLPLVDDELPLHADEEAKPPEAGHETILLVEDEATLRAMTKRVLVQSGYNVLEAANGKEGLDTAESCDGPIHLLITDLVMPHLSGREMAERLTARMPKLRVLFMSGYTEDEIIYQDVESAAANFLQKPFSLTALKTKVREILDEE